MRIGRYEVTAKVGETGMSVVYRARGEDGKDVAIKVLRSLNRKAWDRFERERRIIALLGQDAGFVQCIEVVETPRSPAIVMPFLSGGTLRERLGRGPFPIEEALTLARTLARALARAHEKGIVHRDMKPENILFAADGRAFIADLGIAKHFREDIAGASQTVALTRSNTVLGTVSYMPPEQISDAKRAGPAADVFALGAVLYECLAGEPAFMGTTPLELIRRVLDRDAEPLLKKRRDCPAWLAAIIDRSLVRDLKKRYPDAAAVAEALAVTPPPPASKTPLVAAGVAAALLGVAGLLLALPRPGGDGSKTVEPAAPVVTAGTAAPSSTSVATEQPTKPTDAVHLGTGVRIRSAHTRLARVIGDTAPHYHGSVDWLCLSPDDKKALTVSHRGDLAVWDFDRGEETLYPTVPPGYWMLAFGPGGPRALGYSMNELRVWSPEGRGEVALVDSAKNAMFSGVLARDGKRALVHSRGRLELIELDTRRRLKTLVPKDDAGAKLLPLALDTSRDVAVVGREYGQILVFDTRTGEETHVLEGHTRGAVYGALARDGDRLLTSSPDDTVRLWKISERREVWQIMTDPEPIHSLEISPDGEKFLFLNGGQLEVHDMATGALRRTLDATRPNCAVFSHDGARVFAGVDDGEFVAFDVKTGTRLQTFGAPTPGFVEALRDVPQDGRLVACQGADVISWDLKTGDEIGRFKCPDMGATFTADGRAVGFSGQKKALCVYAPDGRPTLEEPAPKFDHPAVEVSPDGKRVVLAEGDKIASFEVATRKWTGPWSSKADAQSEVRLAVSNGGRALGWRQAVESPIFLWDIDRGVKAGRIDEHRRVTAATISRDATQALLGGAEGAVTLWDLAFMKPSEVVAGHRLEVTALAFISKTRAVSASLDRTLRIWDLTALRPIDTIELGPLVGPVTALATGADGKSFLVGTENRTVLRFELLD